MTAFPSKPRRRTSTLLVVVIVLLMAGGCSSPDRTYSPLTAYELRMAGKADEARAQLIDLIGREPGNAAAHYELARTMLHMALGDPRRLPEAMERMNTEIDQAVKLDPQNLGYRVFQGHVAFITAYMALQQNDPAAAEQVARTEEILEATLELRPDHHTSALHLVELYGSLPAEIGGDSARAVVHAEQLERMDPMWGARARALLLPADADLIAYWKDVLETRDADTWVLHELGRACLFADDVEGGAKYFEMTIDANPDLDFLRLDLARYCFLRCLSDPERATRDLPSAEKQVDSYLAREHSAPLEAYAVRLLVSINTLQHDSTRVEELRARPDALDPYHSKASGLPPAELFVAHGELATVHRYLFRPL